MNLKESLEKRFSVRAYANRKVEREKLEYIVDCARLAPSAANKQPWLFLVVQSDEAKRKIHEVYAREWFADADAYIIVCANRAESWKRVSDGKDPTDIDAAIAATAICLAVEDMGLVTCWVGNFIEAKVRLNFALPDEMEAIAIFPIAYAEEGVKVPEKKRKALHEVSRWL